MGKYFSFGQYNKNFKYIILACFFNILVNLIFGLDLNINFKQILLFYSEKQEKLYKHSRVHEIFRNIGIFIFACAFYKFETVSNKKEITSHKITSYSSKESNDQIILIFNDLNNEMGNISILIFSFILMYTVILNKLAASNVGSKLNAASFSVSSLRINIINFKIKYFLSL